MAPSRRPRILSLTNIFDRLGVSNRLELALYALHHGLKAEPAAVGGRRDR